MRRFFIILISFAVIVTTVMLSFTGKDNRPFPEKLEQMINDAPMKEYQDSLFGYVVRYPACFEQTPDSLIKEPGFCRFSYWDNWVQIVQMAFIQPNQKELSVKQGMDSIGVFLHATKKRMGRDFFILSGPLYVDGSHINGYRFHVKYVQHRKIWFVLQLTYPENCTKAVQRITEEIDQWHVWEDRFQNNQEGPLIITARK